MSIIPDDMSRTVASAAKLLRAGKVVVVPTETVYGLGANALDDQAVRKIYEIKGRPSFNPLIVHVESMEKVQQFAHVPPLASQLAREFWPGPLTMVLELKPSSGLAKSVTANLTTVGVRIPDHPVMRDILSAADIPIAAPSANLSGKLSPTSIEHIKHDLEGKVDLMVDAGATVRGIESTIIAVDQESCCLLRPGAIAFEDIARLVPTLTSYNGGEVKAPGMLLKHYAPQKPLRLNATSVQAGEGCLCFGASGLSSEILCLNLSEKADLVEAARNLFDYLHLLDNTEVDGIAVAPIPDRGIGTAINDRLRRAASSAG